MCVLPLPSRLRGQSQGRNAMHISQGWLYVWTACPQPHYSIWLLFVKDNYQTTTMFKQSYYTCLIVCFDFEYIFISEIQFWFFFFFYGLFVFVRFFFFYFTFLELYDPPEASLIATGDGGHICEFRGEWSFTVLLHIFLGILRLYFFFYIFQNIFLIKGRQ